MLKRSDEIRNKYIKNPPEGMTADDIRHMSEDDLLDMDYFLNEDDVLKNRAYSALFLNIAIPTSHTVDRLLPAIPYLLRHCRDKFRKSKDCRHHALLPLVDSRHPKKPSSLSGPSDHQIMIIKKAMQQKAVISQVPVTLWQLPQML